MSMIRELTHTHRHLDDALAAIVAAVDEDEPDRGELASIAAEFTKDLVAHAKFEEETLFVAAQEVLGEEWPEIGLLRQQHDDLKRLASELETLIAEADTDDLRRTVASLNQLFDEHTVSEADFLDTSASMLAPGTTTGG